MSEETEVPAAYEAPEIVGKSGFASSEFWVVLVVVVGNFLTHIFGHDWGVTANSQQIALLATSIIGAAYTFARSYVKVGTHKAIADSYSKRYQPISSYEPTVDVLNGSVYALRKDESAKSKGTASKPQLSVQPEAVLPLANAPGDAC